jgi:uncharacterized paraquat-inducible protein A
MRWIADPLLEEWEQRDDPRWLSSASAAAGLNLVLFALGEAFGSTGIVGITLALSLFLLVGAYAVWERDRRQSALVLLLGTLPFWVLALCAL